MEGTKELLENLRRELDRGKIYECSLRSKEWQVAGLQHGENVYVDPRPMILEALLHELLHRLKPKWGERTVTKTARYLISTFEESDKQSWWKAYRKIKKIGPPVDVEG